MPAPQPHRAVAIAHVLALALAAALGTHLLPVANAAPGLEPPPTTLRLSANPTPHEIFLVRLFEEPLVPVGGEPSPAETKALAAALVVYSQRAGPDDFASLTGFLETHSRSPWSAALLVDLGLEYYNTAHYSLALDAWTRAWGLAKTATDPRGKAIGDRAAGELAYMYARLGRMTELEALLDSTANRVFVGSATEKISGARQGLSNMKDRPEIAFRCGPLALHRILLSVDPKNPGTRHILDSASTQKGFSLPQVAELSAKVGLNYRMAHRAGGATFTVPSVVHWKVGHYAALIRREGDRYLLQDPTFQNDVWATKAALEAETSGYYLVPSGDLPRGWRAVDEKEGEAVWGKGQTGNNAPGGTAPHDPREPPAASCRGLAVPSVHVMTVNLHLEDQPVGYTPPLGPPVVFTVRYNHRDAFQPGAFAYSNFGPKWTFDWLSYIKDNPFSPAGDVQYYVMGGGTRTFTSYDPATQTYAFEQHDQTKLTRTAPAAYVMTSGDGGKLVFGRSDGSQGTSRKVFLSQIIDPFGNALSLTYDNSLRLVAVTDAIGQVTTLTYEIANDPYKLSKVTDPFGRFARFDYDASGRLIKITDVIGLTSEFTYEGAGDFINTLVTPYGTTAFTRGESGTTRWLETLHPDGERERVEYNQGVNLFGPANGNGSDPADTIPVGMNTVNQYLKYRNTYYWSKIACAAACGDYSQARVYHWLHTSDIASTAGIIESLKDPLENRLWYDYAGQSAGSTVVGTSSQPAHIGRVLDDGSTQLRTFEYNGFGRVTKSIDPVGRTLSYTYSDDGLDLLEIWQTRAGNNELLMRTTYNSLHQPLTETDAAGQTTVMTYDARGLLLTRTNPRGETTTYSHDADGRLTSIDHPLPGPADSTSYTYDAVGRVLTETDSDGYTTTAEYDAFDRLTRLTYPDGTFEQYTFDRLDRATRTDRAGRLTQYSHDTIRHETRVVDPLGRELLTQWCGCGIQKSLTDALGRTTRWHHDIQGRAIRKEYADGSAVHFIHERSTSRLLRTIDEKGQVRQYEYNPDDTIRSISYPVAAVPTATVQFAYDRDHNRPVSMTDGVGETRYSYVPISSPPVLGAGQVARIDGPWPGVSVTYAYDELGRPVSRAINGVAATVQFDAAGRPTNSTNALGTFTYTHDGVSRRLLSVAHSGGLTSTHHYLGNTGDRLPDRLTHSLGGAPISEFLHTWNVPHRRIEEWSQQAGAQSPRTYLLGHDHADQLTSATISQNGSTLKTYAFTYDRAGNRRTEQIDTTLRTMTYNALNQAAAAEDDPAVPTTYEWDAENRLVAINRAGGLRTEFRYDGDGHRVAIRELNGGSETSLRRLIWCDEHIAEERSAAGAVTRRFFSEGVQLESEPDAGSYLYTRDHLGSVREVIDGSGTVRARYDFDPYGRRTRVAGNLECDFGFTGHYVHAPTGLLLPRYREYDADMGRWLSRDPIPNAEYRSGPNVYQYASNSSVNQVDPLGLEGCAVCDLAGKRGLLGPTGSRTTDICYDGDWYVCNPLNDTPPEVEILSGCGYSLTILINDAVRARRCPASGGPFVRPGPSYRNALISAVNQFDANKVTELVKSFLKYEECLRHGKYDRCRTAECLEKVDSWRLR